MRPTDVVDRYLAVIADPGAPPEAVGELLASGMALVERPSAFAPAGAERDAAAVLAGLARGRALVAGQRFEVLGHLAAGGQVASRVVWRGTLTAPVGPYAAGEELRVDSAMWFAVAGGRILRQETYDCAHPPRGAARPSP